ncbi:DUF1376 domain-containing protein [Flagellimonas nanhaiensis]|nr:DUF1376 domain-containing protein [Allomuricauda nanhaiensis]
MIKDFKFPFFYKEWLVSTQGMPADVRGWYINLLCHQADKGDLPNDMEELAELAGVKISEYQRFIDGFNQWLNQRFIETDNQRLVNLKMKSVLEERSDYINGQSQRSYLAVFIRGKRKIHEFTDDEWKHVSSELSNIDTAYKTKKETYKKYDEWFNQWLNRTVQPFNIDSDSDSEDIYNIKGGMGEKITNGPDDIVDLGLVKEEIKNAVSWKEGIVRTAKSKYNKSFSLTELEKLIQEFDELIWNDGETEKSLKDYKKHFNRWLELRLQRNHISDKKIESKTIKRLEKYAE